MVGCSTVKWLCACVPAVQGVRAGGGRGPHREGAPAAGGGARGARAACRDPLAGLVARRDGAPRAWAVQEEEEEEGQERQERQEGQKQEEVRHRLTASCCAALRPLRARHFVSRCGLCGSARRAL